METIVQPAHFADILRAFDPSLRLVRATRPGTGIANHVTFLDTSNGAFVLKAYGERTAWKADKERLLTTRMRDLGIPTPAVLAIDTSGQAVPFAWSLAERAGGVPYSAAYADLDDDANIRLHARLGDLLGILHGETFRQFGEAVATGSCLAPGPVRELGGQGPFDSWPEMHRQVVAGRLRRMEGTPFAGQIPAVEAYIDRNGHLLGGQVVPRLLHMDLHRGNVLVENGAVSAILDVEESIIGHNEYDLMRTELAMFRGALPALERAFMDAYRKRVPLDDGYLERKTFYEVSRTLVWIQCLIEYGDGYARGDPSQGPDAARARLRELIGQG